MRKRRRRKGGSMARRSRAAGTLHQHAEPRASRMVAGQRLAHPHKLRGKVEIQPRIMAESPHLEPRVMG